MMKPNYSKIYADILEEQFPSKGEACKSLLQQSSWNALDVLAINQAIYRSQDPVSSQYRSYTEEDIHRILTYQKNNRLNNTQLANHYKISRVTIAKWKKRYKV